MSGFGNGRRVDVKVGPHMNSEPVDIETGSPSVRDAESSTGERLEQEQRIPDLQSLRKLIDTQVCWWGTRWFEEWERTARNNS